MIYLNNHSGCFEGHFSFVDVEADLHFMRIFVDVMLEVLGSGVCRRTRAQVTSFGEKNHLLSRETENTKHLAESQ